MTRSDTSEYVYNPQTNVSLTEPSPNLCLITDKQSPDTEVQDDQNLRYYVNSTIGPQTFPQLDHLSLEGHVAQLKEMCSPIEGVGSTIGPLWAKK